MMRAFVAAAGMLVILVAAFEPSMRDSERSLVMLMGIAFMGMLITQLSGCFFTADCVSSEKREGTLGLLFLTPLKSLDIVLGKLASHSLAVFFSMLALAPILFMPVLNGGITGGETMRVIVGLIVSLFLSLSVGAFVSCVGREVKTTVTGTFIALVLINAIPLLYLFIAAEVLRNNTSPYGVCQFAPWALPIFATDDMASRYGVKLFWIAAVLQGAMALGFLGGATFVLRRIARRSDYEWKSALLETPGKWRSFWRWLSSRSALKKRPLKNRHPYYYWAATQGWSEVCWLRWFRRLMWLGIVIFFMAALIGGRRTAEDGFWAAFFLAGLLHLFTKLTLILEATRQLNDDRRSGCLELILSTPFDHRRIFGGAISAVRSVFRYRMWMLVALNTALFFAALAFNGKYGLRGDELFVTAIALLGGAVSALGDYRAILWRGSLAAMRQRTPLRAIMETAFVVLIGPWLVALIGLIFLAMTRADEEVLGAALLVWFVSCMVYNGWFARRARRTLERDFRMLATR